MTHSSPTRRSSDLVYSSALGMDKLAFGGLMTAAGIPSLPRAALDAELEPGFDGPYIVKPRYGGSSIGIEIVDNLAAARVLRSEEHTSELQSLMRISYAVFCLKKKKTHKSQT